MNKSLLLKFGSLIFGITFSFIGFVNIFWGNDPYYGLIILILSLMYYLPIIDLVKNLIKTNYLATAKFLIGFFILWSSSGVGELFDKIDSMLRNFPYTNITGI
jgi:uncharacterized membrane protein YagU involved in acid resistance